MEVPGVFSNEMLAEAIRCEMIATPDGTPVEEVQVQPASLDLRLGSKAYRLRSSFLPGSGSTVAERLSDLQMGPALPLGGKAGAVLERGRPYLVPLQESLRLPLTVRGRTNPRSSTGRLDLFTRVITDNSSQFDEIRPGYQGQLWLEVYSNSFTVGARTGQRLAQLRLSGATRTLGAEELSALHGDEGLVFSEDGDHRQSVTPSISDAGLFVHVSLARSAHVGWRARSDTSLLRLWANDEYDARDFWEPIFADAKGRLVLEPEEFYLLISKDRLRIPPTVAAEMVAYDPTNGELRTHYAGFFDPGFGQGIRPGTRAVLEVRAHDVPFMIEDGQPIARLAFEHMARTPSRLYGDAEFGSHYQGQEVDRALPRQFRRRPVSERMSLPTG